MKPLILLSGPVGAGKTTVAQDLVAISPAPVAYIEGDKFWFFIAKVKGKSGAVGENNFRMVMRSMVAAAIPYVLNNFETIVDFSIPPWFLETALKMANFRDVPLHFVALRPALEICAARAASRIEGKIEDYTRYRELFNDFDALPSHVIQEDAADAAAVAKMIRKGVDDGRFLVT